MGMDTIPFAKRGVISGCEMFTLLYSKNSMKSAVIMILVYFSCVAMITLCFRLTIIYGGFPPVSTYMYIVHY